jgi:FAD/FMN-containing dehydrogenase
MTLTAAHFDDLSRRVAGPLLRPGAAGWADAVLIWNALAARNPALVLQPTCASDVAAAVRFAHDNALLLSVKGGGHNIAGTALADGGLTLDMSRMRDVTIDPAAKLAHIGPGCLLRDIDRATQAHGLAAVLGLVSQTGVAGLTLGGGFGYLTCRFGWAVDNLVEVEVVTADGRIRTATAGQNPELFWALRGGGGNFGVVTRFTVRLHQVGPTVTGGFLLWGADRLDDVLDAYRQVTGSAPRELTAGLFVILGPPAPFLPEDWHGEPVVGMFLCHTGRTAVTDLAAVHALGPPLADLVTDMPYVQLQSMFDDDLPKGLHYYEKTEFLSGLTDQFLAAFRDGALTVASPVGESVMFHIGGALNERDPDDGAVGNRDARYVTWFAAGWPSATDATPHIAWVRHAWQRIRPFSTGGNYINFQTADDDTARTAQAYGANYPRLQHLKARYDPDNLFRTNRNISPSRR